MARVKLTEYRAKKLILGDAYQGISSHSGSERLNLSGRGVYVAKVDQGVKKRFKQGLVAVKQKAGDLPKFFRAWEKKGFSQFIVEPYFQHEPSEEQYFSLERIREGLRLLHAKDGGVNIEEHVSSEALPGRHSLGRVGAKEDPKAIQQMIIKSKEDCATAARKTGIPRSFLERLYDVFNDNFFAFIEINPLIVRGEDVFLLDAAALVDSTAQFFVSAKGGTASGGKSSWTDDDVVKAKAKHPAEIAVEKLAATTPAALSLKVLNKDGAIFFLLSGGGGSIVIADEAALRGVGAKLGNYGEYSGGPTREETYLYAKEVLGLMLASKSKRKALVIAGGVANFTDIKQTFAGIIDAISEAAPAMRKAGIKVFVRRGGPNEVAGLRHMREFLETEKLIGSVYGSDTIITQAIEDAVNFVIWKPGFQRRLETRFPKQA